MVSLNLNNMISTKLLWVAGIGSILGAFLFHRASGWWERRRVYRRRQHGLRAEAKVTKILKRYGYKVRGIQPSLSMAMVIDHRKVSYQVRPDAVAKKKGLWYLVEVKTGRTATNPVFTETRRQLLEYYYSMPIDGVLLVNADAGTVHSIRFSGRNTKSHQHWCRLFFFFLLGAITGIAAVYVI